MNREEIRGIVTQIADIQRFAILSTGDPDGAPHATIVCFVAADQLRSLIFLTPRTTRKFHNLDSGGPVSIFIDDRNDKADDIRRIYGIEARGEVSLLDDKTGAPYRSLFRRKYPELADFTRSLGVAWCRLDVDRYDIVHRFQEVVVYRPGNHP